MDIEGRKMEVINFRLAKLLHVTPKEREYAIHFILQYIHVCDLYHHQHLRNCINYI